MTKKYTEKTNDFGWKYIERRNSDKTISIIPLDLENMDYQEYLASLEATQPETE